MADRSRAQRRWILPLLMCAALAACDDDDDAPSAGGGGATPSETTVAGILVTPIATAAASAVLVDDATQRMRALAVRPASAACPQVPDGYDPLAGVVVSFIDAGSATLATLTTDSCGNFSGKVPAGVTRVTAAPTGVAPISQPVSAFTGAAPTLASGVPSTANLVLSVLQDLGGGKVALTVTDSLTGKAVLGLTGANFAFAIGTAAQAPSSITYGASTAQAASVSIVLDSSGSMASVVGTTGKTAIQIASIATHTLLDGFTSGSDEAGVTIFSSSIFPINDATLARTIFSWTDTAGVARAPYSFSATGLTKDIVRLRPIADLYNSQSAIYLSNPAGDPVHPSTGNLRLRSSYALSGSTAFYDATSAGLALLGSAGNSRKIVVAMTDGVDNASTKRSAGVIAEAVSAGIPMYMVAFGARSAVDEPTMQKMATDSGGEYKRVEGADLAGLFQSIQTGIRFQYLATFPAALASGSVLNTTVTAASLTATRTLTIR